jgi:hypothetical protein
MRYLHTALLFAALLIAGMLPAPAQNQPKGQQPTGPAPARPYKPVAITAPKSMADASFESLRQQLGDAAKRKDRAALARLVVAQGFFWEREGRDAADKRKSGIDNLSTALGLNNKDSVGWEMLAGYSEDPTAAPSPDYKGTICAPADPIFSGKDFDDLIKATQTDETEWGYPVSGGIEVHAAPQANAAVIEKLGLVFVRVMPEPTPANAAYVRVVTPGGKTGYVSVDAVAPLGNDQLCYLKDGNAWKIGGYIGGGEPQ